MLHEVNLEDVAVVGGKNASLGDMIQGLSAEGIQVMNGFATTVDAYYAFLDENGISEKIESLMDQYRGGTTSLSDAGTAIRKCFIAGRFPASVAEAITEAYQELAAEARTDALSVAVRSSATAEDLPEASFAGMLESCLNVKGEAGLLNACRHCFSSLFTDRAIRYREEMGLGHLEVALSVGVLPMVRSDRGCAGVMFSIEKDTGFPDLVGFGRRNMDCTRDEIRTFVIYQMGALQGFCQAAGTSLAHVKPHGNLYLMAVDKEDVATAIAEAIVSFDPGLPYLALAGAKGEMMTRIGAKVGLKVVYEAFPDRAYTPEGNLVSRRVEGAVIHDPKVVAERALMMAKEGRIKAVDGTVVELEVQTLCVHGDNPSAVDNVRSIRQTLEAEGVAVIPLSQPDPKAA